MAKWAKVDYRQFEKLQKELEKFEQVYQREFYEAAAKELAARLLAKVIKRTPVGDYSGDSYITKAGNTRNRKYKTVNFTTKAGQAVSFKANVSDKKGGTLRRAWTVKTEGEAISGKNVGVMEYVDSIKVTKVGDEYQIEIINPMHYASYVEYGHRTRNHKGWVDGRFMLTKSEKELQTIAPKVLEKRLLEAFRKIFNEV